MRSPYTQLYVHLVWGTWDRLPLITSAIEPRLYAVIAAKCRELKCIPLAIGGIADHVHLLVKLNPAVSISNLAKEVKGSTSHLITHEITPNEFFKWQGGYGAFTLHKNRLSNIEAYIQNQKQHHSEHTITEDWEQTTSEESQ